jgi:hypothetical protein
VWFWGSHYHSDPGDGTSNIFFTPVQVQNLNNIIAISGGGHHTAALRNDGTVWAWGRNFLGQLGDGTTTDSHTPVQVQNLNNITAISAASEHTVALRSDGIVWAWGNNHNGKLGDGTPYNRHTPVQVQNLSNITTVSAAESHTAALRNDGTVWVWGNNADARLGVGGRYPNIHRVPMQVFTDSAWRDTFFNVGATAPGENVPQPQQPATGDIRVRLNGNYITFDQPPIIQDGRTLVPLRAIFEALGAEIDWDSATQTVTATTDDIVVILQIGNNVMTRNGENIALDVPAQIVNNRTLVPVRAIAESFGADVEWCQESQTVIINVV